MNGFFRELVRFRDKDNYIINKIKYFFFIIFYVVMWLKIRVYEYIYVFYVINIKI